jgi:ATP adenylyltransferase
MEVLFTPWRYSYITATSHPHNDADWGKQGCFLCAASREPEDPDSLVVHATLHHLVVLNRYPYSNGHLMVAPRRHLAEPDSNDPDLCGEFWPLVLRCRGVLERAYSPSGLNMGMNLGTVAGAGVTDHYHFHLVPRWDGDTNFMSVVGRVRLVPEELQETRSRLRQLFTTPDPGPADLDLP